MQQPLERAHIVCRVRAVSTCCYFFSDSQQLICLVHSKEQAVAWSAVLRTLQNRECIHKQHGKERLGCHIARHELM